MTHWTEPTLEVPVLNRLLAVMLMLLLLTVVAGFIVLLVATQGWMAIPMITIVTVIAFALALLD